MSVLTRRIERAMTEVAGLAIAVEEDEGRLVLSGIVSTDTEREAALDIARDLAQGRDVDDAIEVDGALPERIGRARLGEARVGMFYGATPGLESDEALSAVDFTDAKTIVDSFAAAGPSEMYDDIVSEGGTVYVPPTDPVGTNTEVIGGFQSDSRELVEVERSALDGQYGDEALADAIRRELREDSATTALDIQVEVRQRVALLRGQVPMLDDAENAEEVASRVPGVARVREQLDVAAMARTGAADDWARP